MKADCRACKYFIPYYRLSGRLLENVLIEATKHKVTALGWCTRWHKIVTYYTGRCSGFRRKRKTDGFQRTLEEFIRS